MPQRLCGVWPRDERSGLPRGCSFEAQLAAAANRAAVESFKGLPVKHAMSPGAVTDAAVGSMEVEEGGPELDIIDALAGRIRAGVASGEFGDDKYDKPPGNGAAAEAGRAAAVYLGARSRKHLERSGGCWSSVIS